MSKEHLENVIITLCLMALIWLSFLSFGLPVATESADASWTQALGYAFKHRFQAGVDYVFTFGPLGYLSHPAASHDADLFYLFVTWQIILGLGFSLLFFLISAQLKSRIDKFVYFFLLIVVVSDAAVAPKHLLSVIVAVILAITLLPVVTQSATRYLLFGGLLWWLAMLSLTKFPNFILATIGVGSLGVVAWNTQSRRLAMTILGVFTLFLISGWLLTGQSLLNLPLFIKNSLTMASAYSDTMGGGFNWFEIKLALVTLLGVTFMLTLANWVKPFQLDRLMIAGMALVGLFFAWKEGFVRHDTHSMTFFTVALLIPFFIEYDRPTGSTVISQVTFYTLRYVVIFTALTGLLIAGGAMNYTPRTFIAKWNERIVDNYKVLTRLPTFKTNQANTVANRRQQYDLPNIRAAVGQATVDIFSWEQGVLFLNGLNWHPRPIFQSYAAYTSSLLAINGDFYADQKRAPEFVIFKLQEIDGRFPFASDTEALKIILRDYQPLFSEKGYLLLKHVPRGQGRVLEGKTLLTRQVKIGELLDIHTLNHQPLLLNLDIRKSWLGHLMSFFYRLPVVYLDLGTTTDGTHQSYRILPTMAQSSFMINPLIFSQSDLMAWYTGNSLKILENLKVLVTSEGLQFFFQTDVVVTISESPVTPPALVDSVKQKLLGTFYPMFSSKPVQVSFPNQEMAEEGQAVLMVHAPGEMRFQVSPGKHTLTGQFGILADAYNGKCPPVSDGVEFSVVVKELETQERVIFKRFLNPQLMEQDRGIQTLPGIAFAVEQEATLRLLTQPGPANDAQCDWSFWKGIRID